MTSKEVQKYREFIMANAILKVTAEIANRYLERDGVHVTRQAVSQFLRTPGANSRYAVEIINAYLKAIEERKWKSLQVKQIKQPA